jgi:hypothetical protein
MFNGEWFFETVKEDVFFCSFQDDVSRTAIRQSCSDAMRCGNWHIKPGFMTATHKYAHRNTRPHSDKGSVTMYSFYFSTSSPSLLNHFFVSVCGCGTLNPHYNIRSEMKLILLAFLTAFYLIHFSARLVNSRTNHSVTFLLHGCR